SLLMPTEAHASSMSKPEIDEDKEIRFFVRRTFCFRWATTRRLSTPTEAHTSSSSRPGCDWDRETRSEVRQTSCLGWVTTRRHSRLTEAPASSSRRSENLKVLEVLSWERRYYRAARGTSAMPGASPLKPPPLTTRWAL